MPSWNIHEKYAIKIGIPADVAREVDILIDEYPYHDIGRVIPKKSKQASELLKFLKRLSIWKLSTLSDFDAVDRFWKRYRKAEEKLKLIKRKLLDPNFAKAFVLHHCLDFLCNYTLAPMKILNYYLDKNSVLRLIYEDYRQLERQSRGLFTIDNEIVQTTFRELENLYDEIIADEEVQKWVDNYVKNKMLKAYLMKFMDHPNSESIHKMRRYYYDVFSRGGRIPAPYALEAAEATTNEWINGIRRYRLITSMLLDNHVWEAIRVGGQNYFKTVLYFRAIYKNFVRNIDSNKDMVIKYIVKLFNDLKVPESVSNTVIRGLQRDLANI